MLLLLSFKDCNEDCVNFYIKPEYPEITDRILLELIYIIIRQKGSYHLHIVSDINDLKEQILKSCILLNSFEEFKNVVQSLFREGEE